MMMPFPAPSDLARIIEEGKLLLPVTGGSEMTMTAASGKVTHISTEENRLSPECCRITMSISDIGVRNNMLNDPITRHFFSGFIRLHVMYHAAKEPIYGAEITEELVRHGYRLSQGTLYPTLHLLEQLGYLRSRLEWVRGRRRRYYRATPAGKKVVREARQKLLELVTEVIEDQDQPFQKIRGKRRQR
jgi:DNA-binding PadR family transcriptional regulator